MANGREEQKHDQNRKIRLLIEELKKKPLVIEEWNERLWVAILDRATVFRDGILNTGQIVEAKSS